jgi:hypothetical protein
MKSMSLTGLGKIQTNDAQCNAVQRIASGIEQEVSWIALGLIHWY